MPIHEPRQVQKHSQIQLDDFLDIRTLHLHGHFGAIGEPRGVDLGDRSTSDRFILEALENFRDWPAQLLGNNGLRFSGREWRHLRLQFAQLDIVLVGDKIAARADNLSELHKGRPQLAEGQADSLGNRLGEQALLMNSDCSVVDAEEALEGDESQHIGKTILPEDSNDFAIARQMRSELHRAFELVEDHARNLTLRSYPPSSLQGMHDQSDDHAVEDVRQELRQSSHWASLMVAGNRVVFHHRNAD